MISKNSFFSLMKEDMKTRMWLVLLNNIILFLNFPIAIAIETQKIVKFLEEDPLFQLEDAIESLTYSIGASNGMTLILVVCMAFLAAISQFGYLYQKSQVDLYHSLPINRKRSFFMRYLNGIIVYVLPYIIYLLIAMVIISAAGLGQMAIIKEAVLGLMIHLVGYVLCYSTAVLAVCMTGNIFSGVCGIATFSGYGVLVTFLGLSMTNEYFKSYMSEYGKVEELFYYFSPLGAYLKLSDLTDKYYYGNSVLSPKNIVMWMLGCIIGAAVLSFLSYMAYKKRKSESTGKSIAFSKSKGVIKVFIMTMIVCLGTLIFGTLGYGAENLWKVIGFLVSLVLSHILIQIIYELDVKAIRKGLVSTGISAGLGILVFAGFYYGGKLYDSSQVNWEELDYAAVGMGSVYGGYNNSYYDVEEQQYMYIDEFAFENMKIEDKELIQEFAKECISNDEQKESATRVNFKYTLKNGKEVYRSYVVSYDTTRKYIPQLMENQQFKEGSNYIFKLDAEEIDYLRYYEDWSNYEEKKINMSKEEIANLFKTYKEEYLATSFKDLNENAPIFCFMPCVNEADYGENWEICKVYVYPTFTKTLALLEDAGIKIKEVKPEDMKEISITKFGEANMYGELTSEVSVSYDTSDKIEELEKVLSIGEFGYYTNFDGDENLVNQYNVTIAIENGKSGVEWVNAVFIKEIPEWLEEDIKNAAIKNEIEQAE
ncbi:MAG: hypothetical protein IJA36_12965 [Lachnospiraceae bacterium]|nr:hypothetical protein [Lachnospiraceae bacterium]